MKIAVVCANGKAGQIWDSLEFVADNKYIYSLVYNGAYMLPELVLTVLVAIVLFSSAPIKKLMTESVNAE